MKSLIFVLAFVSFLFAQDTLSITPILISNGALIGVDTKYSPTVAYIGHMRNVKSKTTTILISPEMQQYAWQDTTRHGMPPFLNSSITFPDSVLGAKMYAWTCSLDVHYKYLMRQNIVLDSLCKH